MFFLTGIKIAVEGLDTEAICEIGAELAAAGGVLVASGAPSDYTLVPLDWEEGERCVTVFWIVSFVKICFGICFWTFSS